jgi:hypothetical protein
MLFSSCAGTACVNTMRGGKSKPFYWRLGAEQKIGKSADTSEHRVARGFSHNNPAESRLQADAPTTLSCTVEDC